MIKKIFTIVLACALALPLFACGEDKGDISGSNNQFAGDKGDVSVDPNDPFTGDWYMQTDVGILEFLYFYGNGKGCRQVDDMYTDMKYTYDESMLYIYVYVNEEPEPIKHVFKYKVEGMDLFLTEIETGLGYDVDTHYVKQISE